MRRVVTVGMAQKFRVDLYPIQLGWGKSGMQGVFAYGVLRFLPPPLPILSTLRLRTGREPHS
jgi:hypothetical protein